jgi:hypothetical protein
MWYALRAPTVPLPGKNIIKPQKHEVNSLAALLTSCLCDFLITFGRGALRLFNCPCKFLVRQNAVHSIQTLKNSCIYRSAVSQSSQKPLTSQALPNPTKSLPGVSRYFHFQRTIRRTFRYPDHDGQATVVQLLECDHNTTDIDTVWPIRRTST